MIAQIRNNVISQVVALACKELNMPADKLIVRDIMPYTDLGFDYGAASTGTAENWEHDMTGTTVGYTTVTGDATMADQRYVALFGARDLRFAQGATSQGVTDRLVNAELQGGVSFIKFSVGGATKALWDFTCAQAYKQAMVAFSPSAVIIPQNAAYNIYFYQKNIAAVATAKSIPVYIQLIGVTVEPRGKVISP